MHIIGRRDLLRGLSLGAGSAFFQPLVTQICHEARGQAKPNARFVLIRGHWSYEDRWSRLPAVRGPSDFDLPATMEPLVPHRSSLWMVFNMSHPGIGANGGHGVNTPDYLSCMRSPTFFDRTGVSFDRFLAQRMGGTDRFPSVSLSPSGGTGSFDGPDKAYPGMKDPVDAFDKLFAQGLSGSGVDTRALIAQDKSTLDFVLADIGRLNARLAVSEREKLDRYLESLRQVEKKLSLAVPGTCKPPLRPAGTGAHDVARTELLVEIGAVAIACGVTHVLSVSTPEYNWLPLGAPEADGHEVVHKSSPVMAEVHKWRMGLVGKTYTRLRELGVGDSSLVLYTDANGTVHHGGTANHFFVLGVGTLGGYFKTPNLIQYAREAKSPGVPARGVGEVFVSIANAMGVDIGVFGLSSHCQGPMPGLRV